MIFEGDLMPFVFANVKVPKLSQPAAETLDCICARCKAKLQPFLPDLLEICCNLGSYQLENETAVGVLKGEFGIYLIQLQVYLLMLSYPISQVLAK